MKKHLLTGLMASVALPSFAAGVHGDIEELLVTGRASAPPLQGRAEAASAGTVLAHQLEHRPILRPAEILETIPGMVITQHSGGGKANQYFLRGFNLDHSTDFATFIEGAPVNMVTHGHGQGYSDLNFLIPELIDSMVYRKGPYYADSGDFASAGSSHISYASAKQGHTLKLSIGEDGYRRALLLGGGDASSGNWVYGLSKMENDGPWSHPDALKRDNVFLKHTWGHADGGLSLSALYFDSRWNGTDQIPQRYVDSGQLNRFDSLDTGTGGDTHRYQLAINQWLTLADDKRLQTNAYIVDYALQLTGNFTYYANDPVNGDQVTQFDDRLLYGGGVSYEWELSPTHKLQLGSDLRHDNIKDVGVGKSIDRRIYAMDSRASVEETSFSAHSSILSQWTPALASTVGLRYDHMEVDVTDRLNNADSGSRDEQLLSPKLSLRADLSEHTALFLNYGQGYHSNDARGVVGGDVPLMSESEGYEIGVTNSTLAGLQLSVVAFRLALDSELVFVGDDGTTEAKDASRRTGIELSAYYRPTDWLIVDADYTQSEATFSSGEFTGQNVPDSVEDVFSAGLSLESGRGYYGGLRIRYFGPRNLTESGDRKSDATTVVNANLGMQFAVGLALSVEVLNLFDSDDNDITYWYESRPTPTADLQEDYHSHPMIPRTLRATLTYHF